MMGGSLRCLRLLLLVMSVTIGSLSTVIAEDHYRESLWVESLPSGHVHSRMEFLIRKEGRDGNNFHTKLFPRALSEILEAHGVEELTFTLTQGHWQLESWGDPHPVKVAPTGAHVVAWFRTKSSDEGSVNANWRGLTNRLSGLTCASLNFLDESTSIAPEFAYRPEGNISTKDLHVRVGSLPREFICTENLTPWTKLLPCGIQRGIASLLRSKQVFNTHYHSASIHYYKTDNEIHLKLGLSMVYDRPISNSKSVDNLSLPKNVIGSLAIFPCHPATETSIKIRNGSTWRDVKPEDLNSLRLGDVPQVPQNTQTLVFTSMKYVGGYGQEFGKMVVEMTNHLKDKFLPVLYVEVLPWYLRPYLSTMTAEVRRGDQILPMTQSDYFHYTPGQDRKALHKLEMNYNIPPSSKVILSFLVEKGHLKWDEYPPDANHGFYLPAAHFEVNVTEDSETSTRHYYSRILLINLSTPDFSMPYNVICLTCTVVALAFGPIHNITTKRLLLKLIPPRGQKIKQFFQKLWKSKKTEDSNATETSDSTKATNLSDSAEASKQSTSASSSGNVSTSETEGDTESGEE